MYMHFRFDKVTVAGVVFFAGAVAVAIADPTDYCYQLSGLILACPQQIDKTCPGINNGESWPCHDTRTNTETPAVPSVLVQSMQRKHRSQVEYLEKCNDWSPGYTIVNSYTCTYNRETCGTTYEGECINSGTSSSTFRSYDVSVGGCCH